MSSFQEFYSGSTQTLSFTWVGEVGLTWQIDLYSADPRSDLYFGLRVKDNGTNIVNPFTVRRAWSRGLYFFRAWTFASSKSANGPPGVPFGISSQPFLITVEGDDASERAFYYLLVESIAKTNFSFRRSILFVRQGAQRLRSLDKRNPRKHQVGFQEHSFGILQDPTTQGSHLQRRQCSDGHCRQGAILRIQLYMGAYK